MDAFTRAFAVIAGVCVVHATVLMSGVYDQFSELDIVSHTAGGFAMGMLALALWQYHVSSLSYAKGVSEQRKTLVYLCIILGFVALVGISWEWFEYGIDYVARQLGTSSMRAQENLGDTMADFFFDLLGGLIAFIFFHNRSDKK